MDIRKGYRNAYISDWRQLFLWKGIFNAASEMA